MKPYSVILKEGHPYGLLAGVSLPGAPDPVPEDVLERLHPEERDVAVTLRGYRQVEWVGGRLAAAAAMRLLGHRPVPVLSGVRGAPSCAADVSLSISHKRNMAVALAARPEHGTLGVDVEDLLPARLDVAPRVLTPAELSAVRELPEDRQWTAILLRFCAKEAIYKALAPRLARYIDFEEAEVEPHSDGNLSLTLHMKDLPASISVEGRAGWLTGQILAAVRVRWA